MIPGKFKKSSESQKAGSGISSRALYFSLAIAIFVVSTTVAFNQAPRSDPEPVSFFSLDWWIKPIEINASQRLPVISSRLNGIFVLPGTEKIWAVGDGGMIVHSDDG